SRRSHLSHRPLLHSFPTRRSSDLDVLRCEALSEKLRAEAGRIDGEEKKCRENCYKYMEKVEQCTTLTELSRIRAKAPAMSVSHRSEEHTSELQSRFDLVCRLLLEK